MTKDLSPGADVFVQNARLGVMEHIGYDTLHALNPDLIYLPMSGFGADGPAAERWVYDLVIQAMSGMVPVQTRDHDPEFVKTIVCDKVAAMVAAQVVSSALFARERSHVAGHLVELTLLEASLAFPMARCFLEP